MPTITILHTNDVHGRLEALARVATLIDRIRAEGPALYVDCGDIEETTNRLSNLTKGVALHRILTRMGCAAFGVGNAALIRYSPGVLADQAAAAGYPLLLANLRPAGNPGLLPGVQASALIPVGPVRLGLVGVTAPINVYERFFNLAVIPAVDVVREQAAALRAQGADAVIVLSHLGLDADQALAAALQGEVTAILGGHTHDLLPDGEWVGDVLVAQAGNYAEHLGRIDLEWDGARLTVRRAQAIPVGEDVPPAPAILDEIAAQEAETERFLDEEIGFLAEPLDESEERECGVGNLMADMLRERANADVGVLAVGHAFHGPLPAGPLRRVTLWDVCSSPANPGVVTMTGAQLVTMVTRGLDPQKAAESPPSWRGRLRGLMHLSGARMQGGELWIDGAPVQPGAVYRVAGSDAELEASMGYTDPDWGLQPEYDVSVILREALEPYLAQHSPVHVPMGRCGA